MPPPSARAARRAASSLLSNSFAVLYDDSSGQEDTDLKEAEEARDMHDDALDGSTSPSKRSREVKTNNTRSKSRRLAQNVAAQRISNFFAPKPSMAPTEDSGHTTTPAHKPSVPP